MNKKVLCATTLLSMFASVVGSQANTYIFNSPSGLNSLSHSTAVGWGINFSLADDEIITGASITFSNIFNTDRATNDLYVSLLDNFNNGAATYGLTTYTDDPVVGNYFLSPAFTSIELEHYHNLSTRATTILYNFTSTELTTLSSYLSTAPGTNNSNIGLGFDADCYYKDKGITFKIETTTGNNPVPEPATMVLFGLGMAGIGYFKRQKQGQA